MLSKNVELNFENANSFMLKIEDLVREIVTQNNLSCYRIESNMKQYTEPGSAEISYLPTIRVVTYFEDTVGKISDVLNAEFDLIADKPADKKAGASEQFSYKHFNYKASLKANRLELTEYKRSGGKQFQIQLCSMLQDALSGIEKEFGYDNAIPEDAKRDFYRVSTLLEMADMELLKIRSKLNLNKSEVVTASPTTIAAVTAPVSEVPQAIATETLSSNPLVEKSAPTDQPTPEEPKVGAGQTEAAKKPAQEETPQTPAGELSAQPEVAKRRPVLSNMDKVVIVNVNANGMIEKTTEKAPEANTPLAAENEAPFFEDKMIVQEQQQQPAHPVLDENDQITEESLREYAIRSSLLKEVDTQIAERAGARINNDVDIEGDVERLRFLKVHTLKQLHEKIADNKNEIIAFAEKWIGKDNGGSFDSGIGLFYLEYLLVGKKNDPAFAVEYVVKFISDNDYSARYIIPTYNSIRNAETAGYSHLTLKA